MSRSPIQIDTVRASRDGHEYHEAWAARMALRLVLQLDGLTGIAVEGLSPADHSQAATETVEIADLAFYYGKTPTFDQAQAVVISQAKYSISKANKPFRAADAAKTIQKFAQAYRDQQKAHGKKAVAAKLEFELLTNRPADRAFVNALRALASGRSLAGEARKQAKQFKNACGFTGGELKAFAKKVRITGATGNLRENKDHAARVIADWSVASDAMARLRLLELRNLVRSKAGSEGQGQNLIKRVDVLAAMQLQSEKDLLPFPPRFPKVGAIVPREQLDDTAKLVPKLKKPLLIHAAGGVGKTVFLQSLVSKLSSEHKCIQFDCFDGGVYRSPDDGRHRPRRGLAQIVNSLACSGLCDPFLPVNDNIDTLFKTLRLRLCQCVDTLRRASPSRQLVLVVDAIDNAAQQAKDKREDSFPKLFLESLAISGPIDGVKVIVSCRTHRRELAKGNVECEEIELRPFSEAEATKFLHDRIKNVTETQIRVALSRSGGNPRILEHLTKERALLATSALNKPIALDDLIRDRIRSALGEAMTQGYQKSEINAFLAGLSVLPPPVPLREYATANNMDVTAVQSFAADLSPLLEQTKYGLTFRDEPTETFILENYAADKTTLRSLANNLLKSQASSAYAADALPSLLEKLDDGKKLFDLAFNDTVPKTITSTVGKQKVRYSRIKAAVLHAARNQNYNYLVRLLVELSTVASTNQRGTDYLVDNPELVVVSQDADAMRRLIEDRSHWPGTKHARVAIALALSQDANEALRHAITANDWFQHFYRIKDEERCNLKGPTALDVAAIPFCLIALNRANSAAQFVARYFAWFSFEVAANLFRLLAIAEAIGALKTSNISNFLGALKTNIGVLAGTLSFRELDKTQRRSIIKRLSAACAKATTVERIPDDFGRRDDYRLHDGLLKAAVLALREGLRREAKQIVAAMPRSTSNVYVFLDRFGTRDAFPFVATAVVRAAAANETVSFHSLLPEELVKAGQQVQTGLSLQQFSSDLKAEAKRLAEAEAKLPKEERTSASYRNEECDRFVNQCLAPLHELAVAFLATLSSDVDARQKAVLDFIAAWERLKTKPTNYSSPTDTNNLFANLGRQLLEFLLWTASVVHDKTVETVLQKLSCEQSFRESSLIASISVLGTNGHLHELAGKYAVICKARIEQGDDVSSRASMFSQLSKAMLLASIEEAKAYFRNGLEQMDAIGSDDYEFTNELLAFSGSLSANEIEPADFHTLSNLCELNLTSDEEKYPWVDFGRALSRTSGVRGLAKLARWHDRNNVSLEYSLLPYLFALIEQDKIEPDTALALLRLSDPVEFYSCGTSHLAKLIEKKNYPHNKELVGELINQFEQNNPGSGMAGTTLELAEVAGRVLGINAEITKRLSNAGKHYDRLREEQNARSNVRSGGEPDFDWEKRQAEEKKQNTALIKRVISSADPCNDASMSTALAGFSNSLRAFDLKREFLRKIRGKVKFSDRPRHIEAVAKLENVELFAKLDALKDCKNDWSGSSQAVSASFNRIGVLIVQIHADDFINHGHFYGSTIRELATLCGLPFQELVLELIRVFARPNEDLPPSVWLDFATQINSRANPSEGRSALIRLLRGGAAKLSDSVFDGKWTPGLYPPCDQNEISANLIWFMLGSPSALDRWRAAHSLRTLARFNKWKIIDRIVSWYREQHAGPFQAKELPFYFFHARLWLLISLDRLAIDWPKQIAKHSGLLRKIALESDEPHVLLKHFASRAILKCQSAGALRLTHGKRSTIETVNVSPFQPTKIRNFTSGNSYTGRPDSDPEPENSFHLDYEFNKHEVEGLGQVFDFARWKIQDRISTWVRKYDQVIQSMYDSRGRDSRDYSERQMGVNSKQQGYGHQLGWHGLHVVAGQLLAEMPTVIGPYDTENPWPEWLGRRVLTRADDHWLSDGMDPAPLEAQVNVLEIAGAITSKRQKILGLLRLDNPGCKDLVVVGNWTSADGVSVMISSALIVSESAHKIALKLSKADGFSAWLPLPDDGEEFGRPSKMRKPQTFSCVVSNSQEAGLDEKDPLGSIVAECRYRFSRDIITSWNLKPTDIFNRAWTNTAQHVVCECPAWGSSESHREREPNTGKRMTCSREFLRALLGQKNLDLLILLILRKYERGSSGGQGKYWHTTAVIHLTKDLRMKFYSGLAGEEHKSEW